MEKILKLFILLIFWTMIVQSCKPTQSVIEKNHIVSDTLSRIETNVIQLPTNYTLIDKSPCKNDSLTIANQYLEIGKLRLQIKSLNGQLVIETSTDTIINTSVNEIAEHTEVQSDISHTVETVQIIPKWCWWALVYSAIATLYIFKKPLLKLISLLL